MHTRDVLLAVIIAAGFIIHEVDTDLNARSESGHFILAALGLVVALGAVGTMIDDHVVAHPIDAERTTEGRSLHNYLPMRSRAMYPGTHRYCPRMSDRRPTVCDVCFPLLP